MPDVPARFRPRLRRGPAPEIPVAFGQWADPVRWEWPERDYSLPPLDEERYWNKLGGTPQWLQGEDWPPGDGWRFAFQFSAGRAGQELGDAAECYGFVNDDGRGAFLWQCH